MDNWSEHISNDTRRMIERVVRCNHDFHKYKEKHKINLMVFVGTVTFIFLYVVIYMVNSIPNDELLNSLLIFMGSAVHLGMFLIVGVLFLKLKRVHAEVDRLNNQTETLRIELINHLKNSWYINDYSALRDQISTYLEKEGIDVRYKG